MKAGNQQSARRGARAVTCLPVFLVCCCFAAADPGNFWIAPENVLVAPLVVAVTTITATAASVSACRMS